MEYKILFDYALDLSIANKQFLVSFVLVFIYISLLLPRLIRINSDNRPRFSMYGIQVKAETSNHGLEEGIIGEITLENIGKRSANDMSIETTELTKDDQGKFQYDSSKINIDSSGNLIQPGEKCIWLIFHVEQYENHIPLFFTIKFTYTHELSKEQYTQRYYFRWSGAKGGAYQTSIHNATINERNEMIEFLKYHSRN